MMTPRPSYSGWASMNRSAAISFFGIWAARKVDSFSLKLRTAPLPSLDSTSEVQGIIALAVLLLGTMMVRDGENNECETDCGSDLNIGFCIRGVFVSLSKGVLVKWWIPAVAVEGEIATCRKFGDLCRWVLDGFASLHVKLSYLSLHENCPFWNLLLHEVAIKYLN